MGLRNIDLNCGYIFCRSAAVEGEQGLFSGVQLRHASLERNKRCILAYL